MSESHSTLANDALTGLGIGVSGGGTHLGRAIAIALAAAGAEVVVFGRRPGPLQQTAAMALGLSGNVHTEVADQHDDEDLARVLDRPGAASARWIRKVQVRQSAARCFDKRRAPFAPRSEAGRAGPDLRLHDEGLRLASLAARYPNLRTAARIRRESAWRLGLDLLLRQASGRDVYHTGVGALPNELFALEFAEFCHRVAALRQLPLPAR